MALCVERIKIQVFTIAPAVFAIIEKHNITQVMYGRRGKIYTEMLQEEEMLISKYKMDIIIVGADVLRRLAIDMNGEKNRMYSVHGVELHQIKRFHKRVLLVEQIMTAVSITVIA
jgi:hypothetical protein